MRPSAHSGEWGGSPANSKKSQSVVAAKALNEALNTDLFEGGLLIGEATVIAKHGYEDKGEKNND
jgi:hypothetical protein